MSYKNYGSNGTIREVLDDIHRKKLVLPAIQREFVWSPSQICQFFDSIMQGYPFGTFLFWEIEPESSHQFKWFDFVRDYHQRNNPHCPPHPTLDNTSLTAVLDGQQRLTALNIGLRGSMAYKLPRWWWNNPRAFPTRHLYLNLLASNNVEEEARHKFEFLTDEDVARRSEQGAQLFKVADIMGIEEASDILDMLLPRGLNSEELRQAFSMVTLLHKVVYDRQLVHYYQESAQDIEKVLQIFIRMNSGGTQLSYSDLLLSTAVAQWETMDARKEIHGLVDDLNRVGVGFAFPMDFVLKAGLMLCGLNVRFRVSNFNKPNMLELERNWNDVRDSLLLTAQFASSLGFNRDNLSSNNALLPIAHYLFCLNPGDGFLTLPSYREERQRISGWLKHSLIKQGYWGSGQDALLTRLQRTVADNNDTSRFPVETIRQGASELGKALDFTNDEIEGFADMRFKDSRVFPLLSMLFPFVDWDNEMHIDHIFPRAAFRPALLKKAGVSENRFERLDEMSNGLANLQLLEGRLNSSKGGKLPHEWLDETYGSEHARRKEYEDRHLLGDVPESLSGFERFYEERRERIKRRLTELLKPASTQ